MCSPSKATLHQQPTQHKYFFKDMDIEQIMFFLMCLVYISIYVCKKHIKIKSNKIYKVLSCTEKKFIFFVADLENFLVLFESIYTESGIHNVVFLGVNKEK